MKTLILTKSNPWCHLAQTALVARLRGNITILEGSVGEPLPMLARRWSGSLILSFCCPWILPASMLEETTAVNFHPAPPNHPGFAPYSWAIYGNDTTYGVTAHLMRPKVDTGEILAVKRFHIYPGDSVYRLQQRTMRHLFKLAMMVVDNGLLEEPDAFEKWDRPPRTRKDFEALRRLDRDMTDREIALRTRACSYPGQPGAMFVEDEPCV